MLIRNRKRFICKYVLFSSSCQTTYRSSLRNENL